MTHSRVAVALIVALAAIGCARDEAVTDTAAATDTTLTSPAGTASPPLQSTLTASDRDFVQKATEIGMTEVQLATNVSKRATSADVRAYADRMIVDHNQANQELMQIAAAKNVDPPANIPPDKQQLDSELAKLSGRALDKTYMTAMVNDHAKAVSDFEAAIPRLADAEVKGWAERTLPVLREHHRMAEQITAKLR